MTYKVTLGKTDFTCSYGNKSLFEYAGLSMKQLNGKLALLAYPKLAMAMALMYDPRYQREFWIKEQGIGDLDDAKKFLMWIFQAASENPGDVIEVRFLKEKGFDNPEGV